MNQIRLKALAKINLGLDVLRRKEDGYHEVKMIMQTINLHDQIHMKKIEEDEIKIIRTKRFGIKPMFPEDACIQMELLGHNFFVFSNAETDEVNVVYKRKDNTYGLIEPEFS